MTGSVVFVFKLMREIGELNHNTHVATDQGEGYPTMKDQLNGFYHRLTSEIEFVSRSKFPTDGYLESLTQTQIQDYVLNQINYKQVNNN